MTDQQLAEIEQRANAATPGPWQWYHRRDKDDYRVVQFVHTKENAAFIAHAREDIPTLIAELRRYRTLLYRLVAQSKHLEAYWDGGGPVCDVLEEARKELSE